MKYAFITGGNRGLGLGFVEHLLTSGYYVFIGCRDINSLNSTQLPSDNYKIVKLDVSNDIEIENAFNQISGVTNSLDLLVNNAGVSKDTVVLNGKELVSDINKLDRSLINKMFDINSTSPMLIIKKFLPLLMNSKSAFIINISSARASFNDEWGFDSFNYGYRGSKAALNIMTKALVGQLPKHVKCFSVDPGDVKTDMNQQGEQSPLITASQIMDITLKWQDKYNGEFMRYSNIPYPR